MEPVTFKCKRSGNTVTFSQEHDILSMRKDLAYTEVSLPEQPRNEPVPQMAEKKRGRPKKVI